MNSKIAIIHGDIMKNMAGQIFQINTKNSGLGKGIAINRYQRQQSYKWLF
jgi:hypothetical protein